MTCPKCGSDQWKKASLVHAEGTSDKQGLILGGSTGLLSGEADATIGMGATHQTEQTKLAARAAPPKFERMPKVKRISPHANKVAVRAAIILVTSVLLIIAFQVFGVESVATILVCLIGALVGLGMMLYSISLSVFGAEANEYRKAKAEAKIAYQRKCADAQKQYEITQICLRCGHFYLPG